MAPGTDMLIEKRANYRQTGNSAQIYATLANISQDAATLQKGEIRTPQRYGSHLRLLRRDLVSTRNAWILKGKNLVPSCSKLTPVTVSGISTIRIAVSPDQPPRKLHELTCLQEFVIQAAVESASIHPAYAWIASHVEVDCMHRTIGPKFSDSIRNLEQGPGRKAFSKEFLDTVEKHSHVLDSAIVHLRDYDHTYDSISDIQQRLLNRNGRFIVERIQHIHNERTGNLMVDSLMVSNAGTTDRAASSLHSMALSHCDIRVWISANGDTRNAICRHEKINVGLWTMMKFLDGAVAFTRNRDNQRNDLINVSVEAWHTDLRSIIDFNNMHQHDLADHKSLTVTISIPDLFMTRVEENGEWSMFCPKNVPDLLNLSGSYFETAYTRYESSSVPRIKVQARELWDMILRSMILTRGPSLVFKDNFNGKSNLMDTPPSSHSNLRTGMVDVLGEDDQLYPRNHASITLPLFIGPNGTFNFSKLHHVVKQATYILNKILDATIPQLIALSDRNIEYRSIAIGIHGLADVFTAMRMPYESLEATDLNVQIAETVYHAALEASCELAASHGAYENFSRSPLANGITQFDFWEVTPSGRYDWTSLRERIRINGVRNASLVAIGPSGGRQWPSGFTESTDPLPSNVLEGELVCPWLVEDLTTLHLWNADIRREIVAAKGSIQQIPAIPANIKAIYRTAWEVDPKSIIKMALSRAPFVCHSQSTSFYLESPNTEQLGDLLSRAWSCGLKTGIHELHSRFPETISEPLSDGSEDSDREMSFEDVILSGST
ncbi:ribonucleotide reductase [Mycena polygramma]|nr:ribonucleotide reductase [Mycena polygramma]